MCGKIEDVCFDSNSVEKKRDIRYRKGIKIACVRFAEITRFVHLIYNCAKKLIEGADEENLAL